MPKKISTLVNVLLLSLYATGGVLSVIFALPKDFKMWAIYGKSYGSYKGTVYQLRKRGLIKIIDKNGKRFLKLTQKGQLEALLAKAKLPYSGEWDGKWRIVMFDIPEATKLQRAQLRDLLKKNNFRKLQASVYISPYPLNRDALHYLKSTGLIEFIRIVKAEELDDDKDLKKKFNLR